MLRETPPLSPLQIVLALWIVGTTLYFLVTRVDLPYHVYVLPQAEVVSRSLASARHEAQLKSAAQPNTRVKLRFRPKGGPYTQMAMEEQVLRLPGNTFLLNTYGDMADDLEIDSDGFLYNESGPLKELRMTVVNGSTSGVAQVYQESGKSAVVR